MEDAGAPEGFGEYSGRDPGEFAPGEYEAEFGAPPGFTEYDPVDRMREQAMRAAQGLFPGTPTAANWTMSDYVKAIHKAQRVASMMGFMPGPMGPMVSSILSLAEVAALKASGYTDEDIENAFGRGVMNMVPGFALAKGIGTLAQKGAKAIGFEGPAAGASQRTGQDDPERATSYDPGVNFDRSVLGQARNAALLGGNY